ncbi:MAG: ComEA family DNA-binding protein [Planctomycetota bacterium]
MAIATDNFIQQSDTRQKKIQSFAFVIAASVCVLLSICFAVLSLAGLHQSYEIELDEQINPNEASLASLVRLPGIGIGRAGAILAYRENFRKQADNSTFRNCDDLQKVKGIGPKTVENICQWLKFK